MSLKYNGIEIEKVVYNGTELDQVYYNGVEVFTSARAVTYTLSNLVKVNCPDRIKNGGTLIAVIGGSGTYLTPETITVTMGGTALTTNTSATSYYTYDANSGTITVYNCTDVINITASSNLSYNNLWEFSGSKVTKYKGSENYVTIPYCYKALTRNNTTYYVTAEASTSGYTNVTTIGNSLFYGVTTLKSITGYSPITTVESEAFRGCTNLQTFSCPNVATINSYAFYNCTSLLSCTGKGVIGDYAFYNCSSMMTFGTSAGTISFDTVGNYSFWNCNGLTGTATCSKKVAKGGKYTIGIFAFAKTNITKFDTNTIDSEAYTIFGEGCFSSNSLWVASINCSNTYRPNYYLVQSSTSSSNAGTYKYIYGGVLGSCKGQIVSGDYVPDVYFYACWGDTRWGGYQSNITTCYLSGGNCRTILSSTPANFKVYAECYNASTSTSTFKSAYAKVDYRIPTINSDGSLTFGSYVGEMDSFVPQHGVLYNWYAAAYVTAQSSGCIAFDTPITLADGTTKLIQDVTFKDRILRFNHDTGEIDTAYCHWINKEEEADKYYKVTFSDNSMIKFIFPHAMYSLDDNEYVQITDPDKFHPGTRVVKEYFENGKPVRGEVTVESIEVIFETIKFCEVVTNGYFNSFANHLLISEPFTVIFQNMYGFNDDLTYKSEKRKQYLDGTYKGYLFSQDYIQNDLRITYKDSYGFRAEEWGMLVEEGKMDAEHIHQMIDGYVNSPAHKQVTITNEQGQNIWPVTTNDDIDKDIDQFMFVEASEYTVPEPVNKECFTGWYCSADNKIYQPGDKYVIKFGTHFTAKYNNQEA